MKCIEQDNKTADIVPRSRNAWSYTPPIRLHGVVLSYEKHRDNFTFTFLTFLAGQVHTKIRVDACFEVPLNATNVIDLYRPKVT